MLRLHQLFFINFFFIFVITLLLSGVVSYFTIRDGELAQFENRLKNIISIIELESKHIDSFYDFGRSLFENQSTLDDIRITIVDDAGNVVAESHKERDSMENHLNRVEIVEANFSEFGVSSRVSMTTKKEYLYVAKKVYSNSKEFYIRVAIETNSIIDRFYTLWLKITMIFAVSVSIGLLITYNISQKIKQEITNIKDLLEHLQNKAYRPHFEESFTYEFDTILKLIKRLAKRLDKRDRQKKKFTQKLIFRDKQNKEIISAISHEFKNPIAVILGYCETITGDKDINPNIRDKFLDKIHANSLRISGIIDRISISIKLENGDFKLKISEFNLKNSILNVITLMQDKYKDREIILNFEESETLMISADKTLIELVLINLIENAIKYSEAEVVVKVANGELLVIDKGIGIDSEELSLVTKKFYRVNKNIWNNSLGLGLNIVKYILKLHQKELIIHSKPNVGSTFKFRL